MLSVERSRPWNCPWYQRSHLVPCRPTYPWDTRNSSVYDIDVLINNIMEHYFLFSSNYKRHGLPRHYSSRWPWCQHYCPVNEGWGHASELYCSEVFAYLKKTFQIVLSNVLHSPINGSTVFFSPRILLYSPKYDSAVFSSPRYVLCSPEHDYAVFSCPR
jgi:hypothetical protein